MTAYIFTDNNRDMPAPVEYLEYRLCKEFGWTITQLDQQPSNRLQGFLTIMNIEAQREKNQGDKLRSEMGKTK